MKFRHKIPNNYNNFFKFLILLFCLISITYSITILPLGDSITDGSYRNQYPGAYRIELLRLLKEKSIEINFVGSKQNGPVSLSDKDYEGWIGMWSDCFTINKTDTSGINIDSTVKSNKPDIVLVLLGTNDVIHGVDSSVSNIPKNLISLCEKIWKLQPKSKILVGTLPPISKQSSLNTKIKKANELIKSQVAEFVSKNGQKPIIVDMYSAIDSTKDLKDGVHPNSVGYSKIAAQWHKAIIKTIPQTGIEHTKNSNYRNNQVSVEKLKSYSLSGRTISDINSYGLESYIISGNTSKKTVGLLRIKIN